IDRDNLRPALEQIIVGISKAIGPVQAGLEIVGVRLVGPVIQVEAADGRSIRDLVLDLDGVFLLEPIVDECRSRVIRAAVVDILTRQGQVLQDRRGYGIDPVCKNLVPRKRITHDGAVYHSAGQRVVDNHWTALRVSQSRKVARTFSRRWKYHTDVSRLYVVIILGSEPKECLVFNDG